MISRRGFLKGLGALAATPLLAKAEVLLPLTPIQPALDRPSTLYCQTPSPEAPQPGDIWIDVASEGIDTYRFDGSRWSKLSKIKGAN